VTLTLKTGACFAALADDGMARASLARVAGLFLHDTRHLADYAWDLGDLALVHQEWDGAGVTQFWSRFSHHAQHLLLERRFDLRPDGFEDRLTFRGEATDPQEVQLSLSADADFVDSFELRGRVRGIGRNPVAREPRSDGLRFAYVAQDGVVSTTDLTWDGFPPGGVLTVAKGDEATVRLRGRFASTLATSPVEPPRIDWSPTIRARAAEAPELARALSDIEALALSTEHGLVVAAGVPNFVCPFGRDGLITAWFLLPAAPEIAEGTLRFLAAHQGRAYDPGRDEAPGKIAHELRIGELARMGDVPFGRYYGTTDATALFLILLRDHARVTGDRSLLREIARPMQAALDWILGSRDPDGFLRYVAERSGRGLLNTSWKDSDDSLHDAQGRLPRGRVAVVEIQGYVAAALDAAADMADWLGNAGAGPLRSEAETLRQSIDARFWSEAQGLHAVALDEDGQAFDAVTSNPGHLLWCGAVSPDRAARVARRMMQPDLWSGWGLRTLSTASPRYQPLSYHNGSVWPHDTGLFAAGLARYGLPEADTVRTAFRAAARQQPRMQLPELFAGYPRDGSVPPLPYVETCRPQAWAAAALVWAMTG
jgi:glycogen debranching enzyme